MGMQELRLAVIKQGLELEMQGIRLTAKAPRCFKIIADEFGIKAKRGPEGKRAAYQAFCERFFPAKPAATGGGE